MYTASIWWHNCDTLSTVIGKDRQTVLNQIESLRDDELDRAVVLEHDNIETFELDPEQTAKLERDGIIII